MPKKNNKRKQNQIVNYLKKHASSFFAIGSLLLIFFSLIYIVKPWKAVPKITESPKSTAQTKTSEVTPPEYIYPVLDETVTLPDRTIKVSNPTKVDSLEEPGYQVIVSVDVTIKNTTDNSIGVGGLFFTGDSKIVMTTMSIGKLDTYNEMSGSLLGATIKAGATVNSKISVVLPKKERDDSNTYFGYYTGSIKNKVALQGGYTLDDVVGKVYLIKIYSAYGTGEVATVNDLQLKGSGVTTVSSPYINATTDNKFIAVNLTLKNISSKDVSLDREITKFSKPPVIFVKYTEGGLEKQATVNDSAVAVIYGTSGKFNYSGILKSGQSITGKVIFEISRNANSVELYLGNNKVENLI